MVKVDLSRQINTQPVHLLSLLLDHDHLARFFNAEFKEIKPAHEHELAGGVGCQRKVKTMGQCFVEEITKANLEGIDYQIVGSKPLKHHQGIITFIPNKKGTLINYYIEGISTSYLPSFVIKFLLTREITHALNKIEAHFQSTN